MNPATPLLLPLDRLSLVRRLLVGAGLVAVGGVWAREWARAPREATLFGVLLLPLVVAAILANVNHVGAQLVARGVGWFSLLFGTVAALGSRDWEPAVIAAGAGAALLAMGSTGLTAGEPTRGAFEPVAFRRSLMVSIVMATAEVQLMLTGCMAMMIENKPGYAAATAGCAATLALATVGLFRLRFWGVLVHLLAMTGVASLVATALQNAHGTKGNVIFVWVATVGVQMLLPMPMLLAIVRRTRVRTPPPSSLPARLFAALVVLMVGSSFASVALHKLL